MDDLDTTDGDRVTKVRHRDTSWRSWGSRSPKTSMSRRSHYHAAPTTLYGELTGCEALLVGRGDRAIITVRKDSFRPSAEVLCGS